MLRLSEVATTIPVGFQWDGPVTVAGLLVALIMLISFGFLVPGRYVKRLERKMDFDEQTIERNTTALEKIASSMEASGVTEETVRRVISALQAGNAARTDKHKSGEGG